MEWGRKEGGKGRGGERREREGRAEEAEELLKYDKKLLFGDNN